MGGSSEQQWYFSKGVQQGPVGKSVIREMLGDGRLLPTDLVWRQGMGQWAAARGVAEFADLPVRPPGLPPVMGAQAIGLPYASAQNPGNDIGQNAGVRWLIPVGRSGWAIAAGYLGLFSFVVLPAPLALIISIIAIIDIRRHPNRHGMGRAIFGLVMGILGTGVLAFMMFAMLMTRTTRYH